MKIANWHYLAAIAAACGLVLTDSSSGRAGDQPARSNLAAKIAAEEPSDGAILPCQACAPCQTGCDSGGRTLNGVQCGPGGCGERDWSNQQPIPFQAFGQGEYVGPARCSHMPEYRLRVDDTIEFIYRLTREESSRPYQLQVGDVIRVESVTATEVNREAQVQPDGTVTLLMIGTVRASRRTIPELQKDIEQQYKKTLRNPSITVTPIKINTRLEDLRSAVDNRFFSGGQGRSAKVMADGHARLPAIGSIPAQGLTLDELKLEVDERYREIVDGLEVTPILAARAPRFVYVAGEVKTPGRFTLEQPTTVMMALALAGGTNNGGNNREIVVFRRTDDWKLMATRLDMSGALLGKRPCPADEIWLRDSDIVLIPKSPLLRTDNFLELAFTRGLYAVVPAQTFFTAKTAFAGAASGS